MKNKTILISGAGIAGLTLAYWLKKYGFNPTIVEKHPSLRTEGYKLDIRGRGVDVIQRMGLLQAVYDARTDIQRALFVDESGSVVKEVSPELCGVRSDGDLEIVRGSLCQILYQQLGDIRCLFGDAVKSLSEHAQGVNVEFEKNRPEEFDLVIGADGLHSRIRYLGFGQESDFLRELGLFVSFYSIPNFMQLDRIEIEYHASNKFAIAYCPRDGMAKAGFAFSSAHPPLDLSGRQQQQEFLRNVFANDGWEISRMLSCMQDSPDFYFDCMAQVHMPHWTKGRIALVGDAAYAVSPVAGQGNSVALVGAYVLAGELAAAGGAYQQAFQCYEEELRPFIVKNQRLAQLGVDLMDGKGASWIKSMLLRMIYLMGMLLPGRFVEFCKRWSARRTAKAANAITLKDYL